MKHFLPAIIMSWLLVTCSPTSEQGTVVTVLGEIPARDLQTSLIHEHTIVDWIGADSTGEHRWEKSAAIARALPFFQEAKAAGVNSFFDCSPAYLGRDPLVLRELAERTGINIVTNTGYYGAVGNKFVPQHAFDAAANDLAQIWIDEFRNGIANTGI